MQQALLGAHNVLFGNNFPDLGHMCDSWTCSNNNAHFIRNSAMLSGVPLEWLELHSNEHC
jgi:hypothetical protein